MSPRSYRLLSLQQERTQAVPILGTRRAAIQVGSHSGNRQIRVGANQLQLDVAIELLEALLASDLGPRRTEQAPDETIHALRSRRVHALSPSPPMDSPRADSAARSFPRASCKVLYSAPRVVL